MRSSATAGVAQRSSTRSTSASPAKDVRATAPLASVASYKAEFLSHYYEGRPRPLHAYAFGNIDLWARLASNVPGVANLTTQLPFLRDIAKLAAGIPAQRRIPPFAPETFKHWFHRTRSEKGGTSPDAPPVLLWAD